jgi:hypothetical protein
MSQFLENASRILETALSAAAGGGGNELAIVVTRAGGLHVVSTPGWTLPALQAHYGAQTAYRVTRAGNRVLVEGRSGTRSCLLSAERERRTAPRLSSVCPSYQVLPSPARLLTAG